MHRWVVAAAATFLFACAHSAARLPVARVPVTTHCCGPKSGAPVSFQYLGTGGWVIRRGSEAVLTAPYFTNACVLRTAFLPLHPSQARIQYSLAKTKGLDVVTVMLAGHSHFDHLLDVPVIFPKLPRNAMLYGGATTKNLLPASLRDRIVVVTPGKPETSGHIRITPILSAHAAYYHGVKLYNGNAATPHARPPRTAYGWKEGEVYAFLIDFLGDDGRPEFTIYYDDAAHAAPYGLPDRKVDVAILCAASFHNVEGYPANILDAGKPGYVLAGHWEDFFISPSKPERQVRLTNIADFLQKLPSPYTLPARFTTITFAPME